ncbi:MAG: endonuclease Q family protein [Candidatus Levyibacteriota bacterium]
MELVLDLHLHSRFSRAVSPRMNLSNMYLWGRKKGINILSVADFTHPVWFHEAKAQLEEFQPGIYKLKDASRLDSELGQLGTKSHIGPYFILSTEVSAIYSENGVGHRIHNLILSPNFETAEKINSALMNRGINLSSDGRPILGLTSKNLAQILFEIHPKIVIIPCHVWTPWFSLYGSRSGYDSIRDCFGEYAPRIFAVETGLSSDPSMNWRIKELDTRSIVSFSDAHSLEKMGREATVFKTVNGERITDNQITYDNIMNGLVRGREKIFELAYTIEYYPEEGKYHYTGHRNCGVSYSPSDTPKGDICPVCHRPLTVGVMKRVEDLAHASSDNFTYQKDKNGVMWVKDSHNERPPSVSLVPLLEILGEVYHSAPNSQKVLAVFDQLVQKFGSEHEILLRTPLDDLRVHAGIDTVSAIEKVRLRDITIIPGFDGEYGKVTIEKVQSSESKSQNKKEEQMGLELK